MQMLVPIETCFHRSYRWPTSLEPVNKNGAGVSIAMSLLYWL